MVWRAWLVPLLLSTASCVNFSYVRTHSNEPVADSAVDDLAPDRSTLDDVIARLGAPSIVWPSLDGRVVMAYAWLDQTEWGVSLSYSFKQFGAARLSWDSEHSEIPAIVLEFDPELRLRIVRRGLLRDIAPELVEPDPSAADLLRTYR